MATERIRGYIMSDDFDRFYELVKSGREVIYSAPRYRWAIRCGNFQTLGRQEWNLRRKFVDGRWRFIDPDCVIDPDAQRAAPIMQASERDFASLMQCDDKFALIRSVFGEALTGYRRGRE